MFGSLRLIAIAALDQNYGIGRNGGKCNTFDDP